MAGKPLTVCLRGHLYAETARMWTTPDGQVRRKCGLCPKLRDAGIAAPVTTCRRGHPKAPEWGRACKPCVQASNRAYYLAHRARLIASATAWHVAHPVQRAAIAQRRLPAHRAAYHARVAVARTQRLHAASRWLDFDALRGGIR